MCGVVHSSGAATPVGYGIHTSSPTCSLSYRKMGVDPSAGDVHDTLKDELPEDKGEWPHKAPVEPNACIHQQPLLEQMRVVHVLWDAFYSSACQGSVACNVPQSMIVFVCWLLKAFHRLCRCGATALQCGHIGNEQRVGVAHHRSINVMLCALKASQSMELVMHLFA